MSILSAMPFPPVRCGRILRQALPLPHTEPTCVSLALLHLPHVCCSDRARCLDDPVFYMSTLRRGPAESRYLAMRYL